MCKHVLVYLHGALYIVCVCVCVCVYVCVCVCVLQPYGVNQVGPVIRFQTTTSHGETEIGVGERLASGFFCLFLFLVVICFSVKVTCHFLHIFFLVG